MLCDRSPYRVKWNTGFTPHLSPEQVGQSHQSPRSPFRAILLCPGVCHQENLA